MHVGEPVSAAEDVTWQKTRSFNRRQTPVSRFIDLLAQYDI